MGWIDTWRKDLKSSEQVSIPTSYEVIKPSIQIPSKKEMQVVKITKPFISNGISVSALKIPQKSAVNSETKPFNSELVPDGYKCLGCNTYYDGNDPHSKLNGSRTLCCNADVLPYWRCSCGNRWKKYSEKMKCNHE